MSTRLVSSALTPNRAFRIPASSGFTTNAAYCPSSCRSRAVELVLQPHRDDDLVHERVPEAGDLDPVTAVVTAALGVVIVVAAAARGEHRQALALGGRPDSDDGVLRVDRVDLVAVPGDLLLGHLEHDRVDAVARQVVDGLALCPARPSRLIASNVIPRSTKNGSSRWPANTLPPPGSSVIASLATFVVVRDRLRADVVRRDGDVPRDRPHAAQHALRALACASTCACATCPCASASSPSSRPKRLASIRREPLHVVELLLEQLGVRRSTPHRGPRTGTSPSASSRVPEREAVTDVVLAVAGVVDVDVVTRLRVELVEVRAAGGVLERHPVGDDRQRVRSVLRRIGVDVRVVGGWVDRCQRCLSVT